MKAALAKKGILYQSVLPHCHRDNLSEHAIQVFNNHLKTGLVRTDQDTSTVESNRHISQAEIKLNLLIATRVNPKLSIYAYIFGTLDFKDIPMAPPSTKVMAHLKPGQRLTWEIHGEQGYTTGPAPEH